MTRVGVISDEFWAVVEPLMPSMRDMAGRFEVHAQTVEDEARRMWASAQNISGAGWSGMAEATSLDTMT